MASSVALSFCIEILSSFSRYGALTPALSPPHLQDQIQYHPQPLLNRGPLLRHAPLLQTLLQYSLRGGGDVGWRDELEALEAIFGDDMTTTIREDGNELVCRIVLDSLEAQAVGREPTILQVICSAEYPEVLPIISLKPHLSRAHSSLQQPRPSLQGLQVALEAEALLQQGQAMIFHLFTCAKERLEKEHPQAPASGASDTPLIAAASAASSSSSARAHKSASAALAAGLGSKCARRVLSESLAAAAQEYEFPLGGEVVTSDSFHALRSRIRGEVRAFPECVDVTAGVGRFSGREMWEKGFVKEAVADEHVASEE